MELKFVLRKGEGLYTCTSFADGVALEVIGGLQHNEMRIVKFETPQSLTPTTLDIRFNEGLLWNNYSKIQTKAQLFGKEKTRLLDSVMFEGD